MNKKKRAYINWAAAIIFVMAFISLIIAMFSMVELLTSFRIVFGSVYVLFLPGFIWTFIFFSKTKKHGDKSVKGIDWVERIALGFGLSIAIVPLVVFYLNLIGVPISLLNSFLTVLGIILISFAILLYKIKKRRK